MINFFICVASILLDEKSSHALAGTSCPNSIVNLLVFVTSSLGITLTDFTCLSNSIGKVWLPES